MPPALGSRLAAAVTTPLRCLGRPHAGARATHARASWGVGGTPDAPAPLAAALVVGSEILAGSVADTNTHWLAGWLHGRGVDLVRVEVVPDDESEIADATARLCQHVGPRGGAVFVSGGVGPTHDDKTYAALAAAFGTTTALHAPTVAIMQVHYAARGVDLHSDRLRMATLPVGAEVLATPDTWVPLVRLGPAYVLPGVPRLFKQLLQSHEARWAGPPRLGAVFLTALGEGDVAGPLRAVAASHPCAALGSYILGPSDKGRGVSVGGKPANVRVRVEGREATAFHAAVAAVEAALPVVREEAEGGG